MQTLSRKQLEEIIKKLKDPKTGLKVEEKNFFGIQFKNVFKGSEFVKWVEVNFKFDKKIAREIGSKLLKEKLFQHCSSDLLPFTEICFYRFLYTVEERRSLAPLETHGSKRDVFMGSRKETM